MFQCRGMDATHNYVVDVKEWRRAARNKRPDAPLPPKVRLSFDVATGDVYEAVEAVKQFAFVPPHRANMAL
jgi:hypothetical protein